MLLRQLQEVMLTEWGVPSDSKTSSSLFGAYLLWPPKFRVRLGRGLPFSPEFCPQLHSCRKPVSTQLGPCSLKKNPERPQQRISPILPAQPNRQKNNHNSSEFFLSLYQKLTVIYYERVFHISLLQGKNYWDNSFRCQL